MNHLELEIRRKIYKQNSVEDTRNINNEIIVFLGGEAVSKLRDNTEIFIRDSLVCRVSEKKIAYVNISDKENFEKLPQNIGAAVAMMEFNPHAPSELCISIVTVMDDGLHREKNDIDIKGIVRQCERHLEGYSVSISVDFYGIFYSSADYVSRRAAKKTILNFLDEENGGALLRKRVFHLSCLKDYEKTAKTIAFVVLVLLIKKALPHSLRSSRSCGEDYSWNTIELYGENMIALVVYEMIKALLKKMNDEPERAQQSEIQATLKMEIEAMEAEAGRRVSPEDFNYIPVPVKRYVRELGFFERMKKVDPVSYSTGTCDEGIVNLLEMQSKALEDYVDGISEEKMAEIADKMVKKCTNPNSLSVSDSVLNDALNAYSDELDDDILKQNKKTSMNMQEHFLYRYKAALITAKKKIFDKVRRYIEEHMNSYAALVRTSWSDLNREATELISDFAGFNEHFDGINELVADKHLSLLCEYSDIMSVIDVNEIIKVMRERIVYQNVMKTYFGQVQSSGDNAVKFGKRAIFPERVTYCLYSSGEAYCPQGLYNVADGSWFRDNEISILMAANNRVEDSCNLPYAPLI